MYASLFDVCRDAILLFDAESGMVLDANTALEGLLKCAKGDVIGRHYTKLHPTGEAGKYKKLVEKMLRSGRAIEPFETEMISAVQDRASVEISASVITLTGGKRVVQSTVHNITKRKRTEEALRASEERYRSLVDNISIGVALISPQMEILAMNRQMQKWHPDIDATRRPVCYKTFSTPARDGPCSCCPSCLTLQDGEVHEATVDMPTRKGILSYRVVSSPIKDRAGKIIATTEFVEDITERKRAEQERARLFQQLRASYDRTRRLAQQAISASEEERRRLSRELHDEASQMFTVLKVKLGLLRQELPAQAAGLREHLDEVMALADTTGNQIREVARTLRPPALDALGLGGGLEEMCREFAQLSGLRIEYQGAETLSLPETTAICLYRVVQEALTNIVKHARAQRVEVRLAVSDEALRVSVVDDGRGYDTATLHNGLGLEGMRERVDLMGGRLDIDVQPGKGTRLVVQVPCRGQGQE